MQSPEALLLLLLELEVQHALRGHPADGTQLALMVHSRHAWVAFQPAVLVAVQWPRHAYQGTDTSCTDLERSPTLWSRQGQLLPWQRARGVRGQEVIVQDINQCWCTQGCVSFPARRLLSSSALIYNHTLKN